MSSTKKQKKRLLRKVEKLFKYDMIEILDHFKESKVGNKDKLKDKIISMIENNDEKSFKQLKRKILYVYNKNDKIKKSPKKYVVSEQKNQTFNEIIDKNINNISSGKSIEESIDRALNQTKTSSQFNSDIINSHQSVNTIDSNAILSWINRSQSSQQLQQSQHSQHSQQSIQRNVNVVNPLTVNNSQQQSYNPFIEANNRLINYQNEERNACFIRNNNNQLSVENNLNTIQPLFTPLVNPNPQNFVDYRSQQAINLCINQNSSNVLNSTVHNSKFFAQNYSVNGFINPSQTLESLIEQQNLLLPQSFQDRDLTFTEGFCFKLLPKYKQIVKIQETQVIGSLSDIGIVKEFNLNNLNSNLLPYNWFESELNSALKNNSLQIQLRFCYITEINRKEQKDAIPEHLCIDVNGKQIYSYSENDEICGPFDISSFCKLGQNLMKFWLNKTNFTWILPCAYQISIVKFETPESFLSSLKQNYTQYLSPDFTKSLISLKLKTCEETAINISITNDSIKTKLICPLSYQRIHTPLRTTNCKHIEVFDALAFFKTNDAKYDWFCPICQTSASYDLLRIDGYFSEILSNTETFVTEVNIKSDGTYETISKKVVNENVVIELDDTMDDIEDCDEITILNDYTIHNNDIDNDCVILD